MASVKPPIPDDMSSQRIKKTTRVYETSSTYNAENMDSAYRPIISSRKVIIQRSPSPVRHSSSRDPVVWGRSRSFSVERGQLYADLPAGAYAKVANTGMTSVKTSRDHEKKEMQDLNERLANYIEKMRFLEAQNRKLAEELAKLKSRWGKETNQIKAMYQAELDEARKCLDDGDKERSRLEIKVSSLEEQLDELRHRIRDVSQAWTEERERNTTQSLILRDCEEELFSVKRRLEYLEADRTKDRKLIATLQDALARTRLDLDNETLLRISAENRCITLEEELEFLKAVHEQELRELSQLIYRDTTIEHREFWKNEMGQALREIQDMYDDKMDAMKTELETFYTLKIQEFRTDTTRKDVDSARMKEQSTQLKTQVTNFRNKVSDLEAQNAGLRRELELLKRDSETRERDLENDCLKNKTEAARLCAELEAILIELQGVLDTKLSLELEITTYRKLLEGEESRAGLLHTLDQYPRYGTTDESSRTQVRETFSYGGQSTTTEGYQQDGSRLSVGRGTRHSSGGSSALTTGTDTTMTRVTQVVKGEMCAKTINSRSAKGHLVIAESASDGTYVTIENTGRKDEDISGWRLRRAVEGEDRRDFVFESFTLRPQSKLTIWARGQRPLDYAHSSDLEYHENSWGTGSHVATKLTNKNNEDRASHTQKTVYLSSPTIDGSKPPLSITNITPSATTSLNPIVSATGNLTIMANGNPVSGAN